MNEEKMKRENTTAIGKEGGGEGGKERAATAGAAAAVGRPAQHTTINQTRPLADEFESALTYANDEERKAAFNKLLEDINMPTSGTFEQFAQLVASDARFNALKKNGEKRNLFNGFHQKTKSGERRGERIRETKRVAFKNGLQDCRVKYDITSKSKIIRDSPLERNLMSQTWFTNIESLKER